jgi:hypothetical protein
MCRAASRHAHHHHHYDVSINLTFPSLFLMCLSGVGWERHETHGPGKKKNSSPGLYRSLEKGGLVFVNDPCPFCCLGKKGVGKMTGSVKLPLVQGHKKMTGTKPFAK